MSSLKTATKYGFLAKTESVYGTAVGLTAATDGVPLSAKPAPSVPYLHDGARGRAPGSGGQMPKVPPSGQGFAMDALIEPLGFGAAYSSVNVPPGTHTLLLSSGIQATGSFTGGAEKWTYAPESGPFGFDSLSVAAYVNGQKYNASGVYTSSLTIAATGLVVPQWSFKLEGIGGLPTDGIDSGVITVTVASAGGTYTRSTGDFTADGFLVGQKVSWVGLTNAGNNVSTKIIQTLTATVMTVTDNSGLVNEGPTATARVTSIGLPVITYPAATNLPPKALNITASIGTLAGAKVRAFTFTLTRALSPRADQNSAGGHAGFTPGDRTVTLELTIEQTQLTQVSPWSTATTLNPYALQDLQPTVAVSLQVGTVQYKRYHINLPQAQLKQVADAEDGATAVWHLTFEATLSSPTADDEYNIVFD